MPSYSGAAKLWNDLRRDAVSSDIYASVMLLLYAGLALTFHQQMHGSVTVVWTNILILLLIGSTILLSRLTNSIVIRFVRHFYVIPIVYMMYDQTHLFVRLVHPHDYDHILIAADRWIFGVDPTRWLHRVAFPALTEYLQICYFLFYLMPIMHALELWSRGTVDDVLRFARMMTFVYFISYLLYFVMPAIGPRFTLHDFRLTDSELPGLWLTGVLRSIVNIGGGVLSTVADPTTVVNRDCMPSGHTMLTLVNILLAFRFRSHLRYVFLGIGSSLIFATVYLRYHYVIDVLVGIALVFVCMPLEVPVDKFLRNRMRLGHFLSPSDVTK